MALASSTFETVTHYNGVYKDLRYINIDAKAGDPSTFWVSKTGRYYRTYADAKEDKTSKSVNPEDYAIRKSFYTQHKKVIWWCVAGLVVGLGIVYLFDRNKLILNGHRW